MVKMFLKLFDVFGNVFVILEKYVWVRQVFYEKVGNFIDFLGRAE